MGVTIVSICTWPAFDGDIATLLDIPKLNRIRNMHSERFKVGGAYAYTVETEARHSAEAYGNEGVDVVATPALIGMLEVACHSYLALHMDEDEATVGTRVDVQHLAAVPTGAPVDASSTVAEVDGRRVTFDVEARWGDVVLMRGQHERAVVDHEKFMASLPTL